MTAFDNPTLQSDVKIMNMQARLEARPLPRDLTLENAVPSGLVFGFRNFKENAHKSTSIGSGGHVTMTIGNTRNAQILTLGYSRAMPDIEGFGVQAFPLIENERRANFLFSIKN